MIQIFKFLILKNYFKNCFLDEANNIILKLAC